MTSDIQAIGLEFKEAVAFFRQKARVPTEHWSDVWRNAHSHAFMVAGAMNDALLADFQAAILKAVQKGTTLAEFRKDFDRIVEKHGWSYNGTRDWRSKIIYSTNLATAYAAGRYEQLTKPNILKTFPYWQYRHSASRHPRLQHMAWDGLVLRADDPWWDTHYPPNGWRCGCRVSPVAYFDLEEMGKTGPDTAPPIQTRVWRNPKTGELHEVPIGIDPGWDYNPGKAWKDGPAGMPARTPPLRPGPAPGDPAGPSATTPLPALPDRLRAFIEAPGGDYDAGKLPSRVAKALRLPDAGGDVVLTPASIERSAAAEAKLSEGEWAALPELLRNPTVALHSPGSLVKLRPAQRLIMLRISGRVLIGELREQHPGQGGKLILVALWRANRDQVQHLLAAHWLVYGDADNLDKGKDAEWPA